jgi:hypothetical protein
MYIYIHIFVHIETNIALIEFAVYIYITFAFMISQHDVYTVTSIRKC